jgi:SAM-dependent methyltransferase
MAESIRPATGTTGHDATAVYALGSSLGESARLQRQAEELAADSAALLDLVGLRPGQAAIDLGCGPRGIVDLLAERVTPTGRVAGLDADPAHTAMAAEFAAGRGLTGVEVITADARATGLPAGSFDLVHARTLLVNLPDPAAVAAEMVRLARPGGWVASMEPDTEHVLCYPPHPAFDRLCEIFAVAFRRNGADPWIGRRVPELLRQAGLTDVEVEARVQMYPPGNTRRTVRLDLVRAMRPQVLEMGLAGAAELDELDSAARAHLTSPQTIVIFGLLFLTWGRKPAHPPPSAITAEMELRRCHPGQHIEHLRDAGPAAVGQEEHAEAGRGDKIPEWVTRLEEAREAFTAEMEARQNVMVPAEDHEWEPQGEAFPGRPTRDPDAILVPPQPEMPPSERVTERARERDMEPEASA